MYQSVHLKLQNSNNETDSEYCRIRRRDVIILLNIVGMQRLRLSLRRWYHTAVLVRSTGVRRGIATTHCRRWPVIPRIIRRLDRVMRWHGCSRWHRATPTTGVCTTCRASVWHRPRGWWWTAAGEFTVSHTSRSSTSWYSTVGTSSVHWFTGILLRTHMQHQPATTYSSLVQG